MESMESVIVLLIVALIFVVVWRSTGSVVPWWGELQQDETGQTDEETSDLGGFLDGCDSFDGF
jgi:hypothetical protein